MSTSHIPQKDEAQPGFSRIPASEARPAQYSSLDVVPLPEHPGSRHFNMAETSVPRVRLAELPSFKVIIQRETRMVDPGHLVVEIAHLSP